MEFRFMKYSIVRCNLERVYNYNEYNKTMNYAKKNIEVNGVREQIQNLTAAKNTYIQKMRNITEPENEKEDKKYHEWENWYKKKNICVWITIGLIAVSVINLLLGAFLPDGLHKLFTLLGLLIFIMLCTFVLALYRILDDYKIQNLINEGRTYKAFMVCYTILVLMNAIKSFGILFWTISILASIILWFDIDPKKVWELVKNKISKN